MEISLLVEKCIESAIDYGISAYEIVEQPKKTNKLYDKCFKIFKELKSVKIKGINELEKLLEHPNDYVKLSAATHFLSINEGKAKKVLKQLENKPELFGFSVEMLLSEWEEGNFKEYLK